MHDNEGIAPSVLVATNGPGPVVPLAADQSLVAGIDNSLDTKPNGHLFGEGLLAFFHVRHQLCRYPHLAAVSVQPWRQHDKGAGGKVAFPSVSVFRRRQLGGLFKVFLTLVQILLSLERA